MTKDADKSLGSEQTKARGKENRKEIDDPRSLGDSQTLIGGLSSEAEALSDGLELTDLSTRYTIVKSLGQGGMGEVLLATDNRLKRQVAIKRIRGEHARSRAAVQRFLTEAQAIAALNHPNIVQVYDYGRDQEGPFLIMEYVDGQSLLERCKDNPLPVEEAVELTCDLLGGLGRAHELGIIHRDIKPANILLTQDGRPKLTDFGLAKQTTADHGQTMTGAVLGTIDFMPPEQRRDSTLVDARSDLWSLAATLYQMLTGKSPKIIRFDLLPQRMVGVLGQALEESPAQRFQSAAEFREALQRGLQEEKDSPTGEMTVGQCPQCGSRNENNVRFCRECSSPLKVPCLSCHAEIPVWDKGCTECGTRQADFLERTRATLQNLKTEVERLREAGRLAEALNRIESVGELRHPRLQDYRHWLERVAPDLREQQTRLVELAGNALSDARAHRAAWDYPSAIRSLKSLPPEAASEEHKRLLSQLQADWSETQQTLQEIQQRVKAKQLDGLLPLVQRAIELRGDREDLRKLHSQLQQREARLAAAQLTNPQADLLGDPFRQAFELSSAPVSLPRYPVKPTASRFAGKERRLLIGASVAGLFFLLGAGWLLFRGRNSAEQSSALAQVEPGNLSDGSAAETAPPPGNSTSSKPPAAGFTPPKAGTKTSLSELTNSVGMQLRLVSPGRFTMGEGSAAHQVTLTQPYYLGVHEVTVEQYGKVMKEERAATESGTNAASYCSWDDATEFCRKLSALPEERKAGRIYRLPTEAEWEYACRAGSTAKFSFGINEYELNQYGWYEGNSSNRTHEVGRKKPNDWGFYDMHGNVWEWCADWFGDYPKTATTDPKGPTSGKTKVLRGGSWSVKADKCRSAYRDGNIPSNKFFTYGIRVVLSVDQD